MSGAEGLLESTIRVTNHEVNIVELPFHAPVHLPFGTIHTRPSAWLRVEGEVNGVPGTGAAEGTALPMQIPLYDDYSGNLRMNVDRLIGGLTDESLSLQQARERIAATDLGGNFATARMTVEASLLDLGTRTQGTTVYEALSGELLPEPLAIPYGKSIAESEYSKLVTAGLQAAHKGAKRIKFKLSPANHDAVTKGITYLKTALPDAAFMVDANGTFDPENPDHVKILRDVDSLGLMMIEEPVSRGGRLKGLDAHRALKDAMNMRTPVALDDAISTKRDAKAALDEGLGEILNLKPGRVGSFLDCVDMAALAKRQGRQIMVGGMFEATPGRTMTLTLAALCLREGFNIPGDVSLPEERLAADLIGTNHLQLDSTHNVVFDPHAGWGYDL